MDSERHIQRGTEHLEQMAKADHRIELKTLICFIEQGGGTAQEARIAWGRTDKGKKSNEKDLPQGEVFRTR